MSILSGMEALGFEKLDNIDVFGENETKKEPVLKPEPKKIFVEEDYLLQKTFECPVCASQFKQPVVRHNKIRTIGHDMDLRPHYEEMDVLKYDVVLCNTCGYAALTKFHGPMPKPYRNLLREKIMPNYKPMKIKGGKISYEEAVMRYKLAMLNAVVRQAKNSEKAYIALRLSWIYRGMRESLSGSSEQDQEKAELLMAQETENQQIALEGFMKARTTETAPFAGMSEVLLDYLIGVLNMEAGEYGLAHKMLLEVLNSPNSSKIQKKQAEDAMEELKNRMKQLK
ncbi:MAG: DUF2225 domain-containing protein [Lachnospiraceae bacterium]|nr:DUF2225 domain-containing protein [Lachnospiraceae bacterium]